MEYFEILTRDGLELRGKKMLPQEPFATKPKGILCIVHGFGEHQERYQHVAEAVNLAGFACYSFDLRGHGKSEGKRGHARQHDYLLDDVEELLIAARLDYNDTPMFLMGHSFGGHIVANFLLKRTTSEVVAAILSAPWLKLAFEPPVLKVKLAHLMKKIWPSYSDTSELDLSKLSRDEAVVQAYANDPLVLKKISAGLFSSILSASDWAIENAAKLKIPTLLYHGTADQVISIEGSEQFAKNSNENLTFERLEGVYHEPHNDYGKEEVVQKIIEWMSTHC